MFVFAHVLGTVLALAPSPSPSPSAPPEIAHVFTADRTDQTLNNTARTTYVITHDQIVRDGYRTIGAALQYVPGVEMWPLGALGSNYAFGIRGSDSAEILVLVDGLPAPGSFSNTVELGNLPTTGVDRIEIVEGGGSTLYGSGSIGGIINVITQRSAQTSATVRYGSFNDKEFYVNTDHVQFSRTIASNDFGLPNGSTRPDSDYASTALHLNEEQRIGTFDVALRAGLESDKLGAPGTDGFLSTTSRQNDVNENANLLVSRKSAQAEATIQFGGSTQQVEFLCNAVTDTNCFTPNPALSTEGRVDFGARNAVTGANEQLLYGVDLSRGVVRSDSGGAVSPGTPPISANALAQSAAYVQERLDRTWGTVYGGMRAERDGSLGGEFSPSAGFVVRLSNQTSLKGNVATAFRAPNAAELYFPGFGNPALQPERAKVADLTIVDSHIAGGASLGWFTNRTNDLIQFDIAANTLNQIHHAFLQGLTFDVRTQPYNGIVTSLNVTDLYRAQNVDTQARLENDPVMDANLRLDYAARNNSAIDGWGLAFQIAGQRGTVNTTLPTFDQPVEFATVNAYLRAKAGSNALVTLRGYNLGNERYAAVPGYPMPGRGFAVELSAK